MKSLEDENGQLTHIIISIELPEATTDQADFGSRME